MWYLEIEASIGRSLKKAKGEEEKKEEKKKKKLFMAFRGKAIRKFYEFCIYIEIIYYCTILRSTLNAVF